MANINKDSYKGHYGIVKGIVTRSYKENIGPNDPNWNDPTGLKRIQVFIPSYYGGNQPDEKYIGDCGYGSTYGTLGEYPWAQVNIPTLVGSNNSVFSWFHSNNGQTSTLIYPNINDVVWLAFEGGDIRLPIYLGTIAEASKEVISGRSSDKYLAVSSSSYWSNGGSLGSSSSGLIEAAREVIFGQESGGNYAALNPNDNGCISVGLIQWNGPRAKEIMKAIRNANSASFDSICASYGGNQVKVRVLDSTDWNRHTTGYVVSRNSAEYNTIKAILSTPESKSVQDRYVNDNIATYLKAAEDAGCTDAKTKIYIADIINQFGSLYNSMKKAISGAISKPGDQLDNVHAAMINCLSSGWKEDYTPRRRRVYTALKSMTIVSSVESGSINGVSLVWPTPGYTNITSRFGLRTHPVYGTPNKFHYGIDIGAPTGANVIAAHSGIAKVKPGYNSGRGNCIYIYYNGSSSVVTIYQHLSAFKISDGAQVRAGDIIGLVGSTGDSTGPHLHFGLCKNGDNDHADGVAVDPLTYVHS